MPSCIVQNCGNTSHKASEKGLKLHPFPTTLERIKLWLRVIPQRFEDLDSFAQQILDAKKTKPYRVCSQHFTKECYVYMSGKPFLSQNAVPSVFNSARSPPAKRFCMDPAHVGLKEKPACVDVSTRTDIYNFGRDRGTQFDRYYGVKSRKVATEPKSFTRDVATFTDPRIQTAEPQISSWGKKVKIITPRPSVSTADKWSQCPEYDFYRSQRGRFKVCQKEMELSEEQTDPVMGNMDKSQRNEKILNLTLEIIYLLSGEDFAVMKKSGDGVPQRCTDCMLEGFCRRHTPTVSQTSSAAIQKENDKIVLELISNIIQLLTGEEWGYIKGNKALYREEIMENFQQLCTKDGDYGEPTGTAAHLQATLCSRVGSSETVGRGGCLTNTPTPEHPTPEITIKEEPPSWEEEEEENYYCINAQWQGAAPSPAMARSANVIATSVKEEPISYEEEGSHSAAVTEQTPTVTPSPVSTTREKPSSCKRRNQSDCSINPLREHIRGTDTPTPITGCRPNTGTAPHYISDANKDKLASHCSSKAPKEQIQGADTPTPIMGNSLDNR